MALTLVAHALFLALIGVLHPLMLALFFALLAQAALLCFAAWFAWESAYVADAVRKQAEREGRA